MVRKTLVAIQKGANMTVLRSMMVDYGKKVAEIRKNPPTRATTVRPFRGSVKFGLETRRPAHEPVRHVTKAQNGIRIRVTTTKTTEIPRNVRRTTRPPSLAKRPNLNTLEIPETFKAPSDFQASPLYGLTMDKFNDFGMEEIEKIHETFVAPSDIQNAFYPVIENGTPSTTVL
jgi:hypothetical protein